MSRSNQPTTIVYVVFITFIVLYTSAIIAISRFISLPFFVKGFYPVAGCLLAFYVFESRFRSTAEDTYIAITDGRILKINYILIFLLLSIPIFIDNPVIPFITLLPLGYSLVFLHSLSVKSIRPVHLLQSIGLFLFIPVTKLSSTYFYFGRMDIIKHTRYTHLIARTGELSSIPSGYSNFPGLHIISFLISETTGIPPHDSILLLGIVCFSLIMANIHLFVYNYTNSPKVAIASVIALPAIPVFSYYSSYFFPQAFAMTFLSQLMWIAAIKTKYDKRILIPAIFSGVALVFSHHFSLIIFLIPLTVLFVVETLLRRRRPVHGLDWTLILPIYVFATFYWTVSGENFLIGLVVISSNVLSSLFSNGISGGEETRSVYYLGETPVEETIIDAVLWFISVNGVFMTVTFAIMTIGIFGIIVHTDRELIPLLAGGVFGSSLILETPLSIKSIERLALPFTLFFAIVIGYGLSWAWESNKRTQLMTLTLLFLAFSTGPLIAMNDTYNLNDNDNPTQTSFTKSELTELRSASFFISNHIESEISTFGVLGEGLKLYNVGSRGDISIQNSQIQSSGTLVHNNNWVNYRQRLDSDGTYLQYVVISEDKLNYEINGRNKVYDSGTIGLSQ